MMIPSVFCDSVERLAVFKSNDTAATVRKGLFGILCYPLAYNMQGI